MAALLITDSLVTDDPLTYHIIEDIAKHTGSSSEDPICLNAKKFYPGIDILNIRTSLVVITDKESELLV